MAPLVTLLRYWLFVPAIQKNLEIMPSGKLDRFFALNETEGTKPACPPPDLVGGQVNA